MADDRKDEAKAPHWTSAQLTEASAQPHPPEIKDQGGAGEGQIGSLVLTCFNNKLTE